MHRMGLVHHAHDHAVIRLCRLFQHWRQAFGCDGQRVIARCFEIIVQAAENTFAGVVHPAQLAVHRLRRADDPATISLPDRLMAQAHPQNRDPAIGLANQIETDPGLVGVAGPRRQHDGLRAHGQRVAHADAVIALDTHLRAQFPQIVEQVVGEAVIIIDQQKHGLTR